MYDSDQKVRAFITLALSVVVVVVVGIVVFHRYDQRILVHSRYWVYTVEWTYTTIDVSTSCDTDSKGHTSCHPVVSTSSHTRCTDQSQGIDLPVRKPEHTCQSESGDSQNDYAYGVVTYFAGKDERERTASFGLDKWDSLAPSKNITATFNVFNSITAITMP